MVNFLAPIRLTGRDKLIAESMFRLKDNPGPGLCTVFGCRKKHVPEKWGGKLHLCPRHRQERWRRRNPMQAAFATLRDHARGRKIKFTLTFSHFIEVTTAAGFWDHEADDFGGCLSIDRILAGMGYEDGNIQVITVSENSAKSHRESYLSEEVQGILARRRGETADAWQMDEGKHWLDDAGDPF